MTLAKLLERLPAYAKDLRLNLGAIERSEVLDEQQLWGTLLATAIAARDPELLAAVDAAASAHLPPPVREASRTGAALMGMNNVYYRFLHLVGDATYGSLPARLRMQGLATHGAPKLDFELWCLAVSAINGCGACLASHEKALRAAGATPAMIQEAARIAAIVHAVAVVLGAERAAAGTSVA